MSYSEYANQGQAQLMTLLKEKLAASLWKEANQLTKVLMLKTSSRKDGDYLYLDIDSFPEKEIQEIDRLWLDHSGSYFGFSAQKAIYNRENYQQFITNVGWYKGDSWLNYDDLFSWESALKGHLPYCGWYFWQGVYAPSTSTHLSSSHKHSHQPHYHAPHRHDSGGGAAGAAGLAAAALAAAPWVIGAAAVGGAGYLIYREVTKDERKRKERLEREEEERKERQQRLEAENKVEKNIGALLALVNQNTTETKTITIRRGKYI